MFAKSSATVRASVYGVLGVSQVAPNQVNATNGTAFMISPGVLVTAAHFVHVENDPTKPVHTQFEAIRAPDIGQPMERASLIAEDRVRDVALLRLQNPRSSVTVALNTARVPIGTSCGSLGFPLASVVFNPVGRVVNLTERFQGANVSAFHTQQHPSGRALDFYETDALMYSGSSGCPGFLADTLVFGMHVASVIEGANQIQNKGATRLTARLAISLWVPSVDIVSFARANGVAI
ncbi:MAG: trypsin-like peptidase domain-containing protein [Nitrospirae bacterium]|nr:MAG: trypsin-like peptidase domain-containing protein [Nitrospirota bacterium]